MKLHNTMHILLCLLTGFAGSILILFAALLQVCCSAVKVAAKIKNP
jgi:hypothetical protein